MATRASRVERLVQLERLLFDNPAGLRAVEIARLTGVQRRTIYRDIDALRARGVPIWQDAGRFGLSHDRYRPPVRLGFETMMTLLVGLQWMGAAHRPAVLAALDHLTEALPGPLATPIVRYVQDIPQHQNTDEQAKILAVVGQGWLSLRMLRLWYQGGQFDLSPYLVLPTGLGGVYLIGHEPTFNAVGAFQLDLVERVRLLEDRFTLPPDFGTGVYRPWLLTGISPVFEVILEFSADVTPLVRTRMWHPSQVFETLAGGGCRLILQVAGLETVRAWILGWSTAVKVIAPSMLRDEVAAEARRIAALYT